MFHNTANGIYKDSGEVTSYTFPENAVIKINDIDLPLGGIMVQCFGGTFDIESIAHFTRMASLLRSHEKTKLIYNTAIFISDYHISGVGYPDQEDFTRYRVGYLSREEFYHYQNKILSENLPNGYLSELAIFFKQWTKDNRKKLFDEINNIVISNGTFPKNLSIIYGDCLHKHITHIVLTFQSPTQCILHIDNTMSPLRVFGLGSLLEVDNWEERCEKYYEKIANDQSKCIELYANRNDPKPEHTLATATPINQLFSEKIYNSIKTILQKVGIKISNITIHHSPHNQKNTDDCVLFAIQNKLSYVTGNDDQTDEMVKQKRARFRAEHAVLSYLLTGKTYIPHCSNQVAKKLGIKYDEASWYPNFPEVCKQLNEAIRSLLFKELKKLYLSMEMDDAIINSTQFKSLILSAMKEKMPSNKYQQITDSELTESRAIFLEKVSAPDIFYHSKSQFLFMSNKLLSSLNDSVKEGIEIDKNLEQIVRKRFF